MENNKEFLNNHKNVLKDKYRNVDMISSIVVDDIIYNN